MNIYTSETEYLKTQVQRLSALVRAQQITIDKLEAQLEQEPVWWMSEDGEKAISTTDMLNYPDYEYRYSIPLYTTPPPQRTWVGLTDEQIAEMWLEILGSTPPSGIHEDGLQPWRFARAIEAAHGIKE